MKPTLSFVVIALLLTSFSTDVLLQSQQSCDSLVYCQGDLLDKVQEARIFNDSKTFVDMSMVHSENETLQIFENLMTNTSNNPSREELENFVDANFVSSGELEEWTPTDFVEDPKFLEEISDAQIREFARNLVKIWPVLARKVKPEVSEDPTKHSLIPVPNGFIIPGGRFKELYYWDSYWIMKGLLISEMDETVKGMLENLLSLVEKYGFVPNGSRVYYLNRSQPPLLSLMVAMYIEATNDLDWLKKNIKTIEKELRFWLEKRTVEVEKNGVKYNLAHFAVESGTPRPESYYEDVKTCAYYTEDKAKEDCYRELKSGAESGWDFSSRWLFDDEGCINTNLTHIQARRNIPVDLNAFLCRAFYDLSDFYKLLGKRKRQNYWLEQGNLWEKSIEQVLYNKTDGIWYDFDLKLSKHRKLFFPSNFAPLWTQTYDKSDESIGTRAAEYFKNEKQMEFQGGIPTSMSQTGEQWDYPNAWPPLQEIVILGLHKSGNKEAVAVSEDFASRWVKANMRGYEETKEMFEKYDAVNPGQYGGGGEYTVQSGFGWTNGVVLSLIDTFFRK